MRYRALIALTLPLLASAPRADEDGDEQDGGSPYRLQPADYDVSVDLNVQGAVTFDSFQAPLQPYGDWVVVGSYGQVWRPRVVAGWRPYYYGRWEWTNEGWFWVSDEPWGWATYHYGRWAYDPYYGWIWIPGYEWAPAWVTWRMSGDAIGWAPLAPGYSVFVTAYPFIDFWWTFVPCVRFASVPVYTVAYAPALSRRWFDGTVPAPARPPRAGVRAAAPAWGGPAPRFIEQRVGRPLAPARILRAPAPGGRGRPGEVQVFRPGSPGRGPAWGWGERPAPQGSPMGRGPGVAPAPGFRGTAPDSNGRGPGPAPAPGWSGRGESQRAPQGSPAPGWSGRGESQRAPQGSPAPRHSGGGSRERGKR